MRGTPPGSRRGGRLHLSICDQASDLSCIKILLTTLLGLECRLKGVPRATDVRASLGRARMFIPTTRHQRGAAAEVEVITGCPKTGPLPPPPLPKSCAGSSGNQVAAQSAPAFAGVGCRGQPTGHGQSVRRDASAVRQQGKPALRANRHSLHLLHQVFARHHRFKLTLRRCRLRRCRTFPCRPCSLSHPPTTATLRPLVGMTATTKRTRRRD